MRNGAKNAPVEKTAKPFKRLRTCFRHNVKSIWIYSLSMRTRAATRAAAREAEMRRKAKGKEKMVYPPIDDLFNPAAHEDDNEYVAPWTPVKKTRKIMKPPSSPAPVRSPNPFQPLGDDDDDDDGDGDDDDDGDYDDDGDEDDDDDDNYCEEPSAKAKAKTSKAAKGKGKAEGKGKAKAKAKGKAKGPRKCGHCGLEGHNRRTCPTNPDKGKPGPAAKGKGKAKAKGNPKAAKAAKAARDKHNLTKGEQTGSVRK